VHAEAKFVFLKAMLLKIAIKHKHLHTWILIVLYIARVIKVSPDTFFYVLGVR
jgi:hypothetical protein